MLDVLRSGNWWQSGRGAAERLERELATYCEVTCAVAVSSGTSGLELALEALGIKHGDEVLVPALTFVSSASAVCRVGAVPVAVDVLPDTLTIDVGDARAKLTARTRAIMPVHLAGQPAQMDEVMELAEQHGLKVIEDSAQAIGARWGGRRCGSFGDVAVISFQAAKLLPGGEGGAVLGRDPELLAHVALLANCGRPRGSCRYDHSVMGTNARIGELQAAIVLAQLSDLESIAARRERALERLRAAVARSRWWMQARPAKVSAHGCYMVLLAASRIHEPAPPAAWLAAALTAEGIPARGIYPPFYRTAAFHSFGGHRGGQSCPVAERAQRCVVWLHHQTLLDGVAGVEDVVNAIKKVDAALGDSHMGRSVQADRWRR